MKFAYLFPGQGAQYIGMGKSFYDNYPIAREIFEQADDILKTGLSKLILSGDETELTKTKNSQPAIFVTSVAILKCLEKIFDLSPPAYTAGLSLGEYTALTAAGIASFADIIKVVATRGALMHKACEEKPGTMAVVLGLDDIAVQTAVEKLDIPLELFCANFNCPGQVVISGTHRAIERAKDALLQIGAKRVLPLQVHGAFHSGLMLSAREGLETHLHALPLKMTKTQVAMNVSGQFAANCDEIRALLIAQVTAPTRWSQGIRTIDKEVPSLYIEIGCGSTLSGMNRKIGTTVPTINIDNTLDLPKLEELLKKG